MNEPVIRIDDWSSTVSALGSVRDKSEGLGFTHRGRLNRETLDALYEQNPIVARVVDLIVDDALRAGWSLKNVVSPDPGFEFDPKEFKSKLDDLGGTDEGFDEIISKAAKWSRLYGGSLILVPTAEDPKTDPKLPLNTKAIEQLFPLAVISSNEALPQDYDEAFGSRTYRQVLDYQITGESKALTLHHTRVVRFEPIKLPPEALRKSSSTGWGPSVVDRLFDDLGRSGAAKKHAVAKMFAASLLLLQLEGFRSKIKTADGRKDMRTFLAEVQRSLSSLGIMTLDKEDSLGSVSLNQTGDHELIDKMNDSLGAAGDMPREIMFNESPAGLNAGELSGPQEIWFSKAGAYQTRELEPPINRLLRIAFDAWRWPIDSWEIEWAPLWTKSEEKTATTAKTVAETDAIYFGLGTTDATEIRKHRHTGGKLTPLEVEADTQAEPLDIGAEVEAHEASLAAAAPAPVAESTPVAEEALNGAQIASLLDIVEKVNAGLIPRDAAVEIVRASFPRVVNPDGLLGSAGIPVEPEEGEEVPEPAPTDLVPIREAGEQFRVPTRAITRAIERNEIRPWGIGAHRMVSLAEVAELAKRPQNPEPNPEPIPGTEKKEE